MNPKISVVMAVYNEQHSLPQAIDSILNQTYQDFEFIIVDDCSSDDSSVIIRSYKEKDERIITIRNESNLGLAESLNIGISHANGEWIARMDGDDISLPARFETQIAYLETHPDIDVLSTALVDITPDNQPFGQRSNPEDHNYLAWRTMWASPAYHGTIMMRRSKFLESGGYKSGLILEDVELWSRMIQTARFASIPDVLYKYRRTHAEFNNILEKRTEATLEICRNFVSMILEKPVSMDEYMLLRNSTSISTSTSLAYETIEITIIMLLDLFSAFTRKNIFTTDSDLTTIQEDLAQRITNLTLQNKELYEKYGQHFSNRIPYTDLAKAYWRRSPLGIFAWPLYVLLHPKIALQTIKSRLGK